MQVAIRTLLTWSLGDDSATTTEAGFKSTSLKYRPEGNKCAEDEGEHDEEDTSTTVVTLRDRYPCREYSGVPSPVENIDIIALTTLHLTVDSIIMLMFMLALIFIRY